MTGFKIEVEEDLIAESELYTLVTPNGSRVIVGYVNYDEHGSSGMEAVRDAVSTLSNELNIPMICVLSPEEE